MSGSLTVIGGHTGPLLTGLVTIPSDFAASINGASTTPGTLQYYLTLASDEVTTGVLNLVNDDAAAGTTFSTSPSVSGFPALYEITNTDSTGAVTGGSISGSFNIPDSVTALVVQAPGAETVTGNDSTSLAVFGANSNVDYSVLTGSGSIFAAGGADSISIGGSGLGPAYFVYSAGNDTLDLASGTDSVDVTTSTATLQLADATGFVTADGNSTVKVLFQHNSGGTLNFVNNSSGAATIYSGAYTASGGGNIKALNAVTAYGGTGGGFYVGGLGGDNSLVGGAGVVTLQGAANGDFLESNSSTPGATNQLLSGSGNETLIGSSTSGANTFQLNLKYVGEAVGGGGTDVVSTSGSGLQAFLIGAGTGTITGSTVAGASNLFDLIRDASVGAADYTITNFASIGGAFYITDASQTSGSSSIGSVVTTNFGGNEVTTVTLTDQTTIKFDGLASSNLDINTTGGGAISITYHS